MKNINNQEKNQIPLQLFHQGTNPYAYEFLGVQQTALREWYAVFGLQMPFPLLLLEILMSGIPLRILWKKSVTVYGNVRCRLNLLSLKLTSF